MNIFFAAKHPSTTARTNPLRHDCQRMGCFNKQHRFPIEDLAQCLPRNCMFSDIDGEAEINHHWLRLEFKTHGKQLNMGQHINYERLTATVQGIQSRHTVFAVHWCGDENEKIYGVDVYHLNRLKKDFGKIRDLESLQVLITSWSKTAELTHLADALPPINEWALETEKEANAPF